MLRMKKTVLIMLLSITAFSQPKAVTFSGTQNPVIVAKNYGYNNGSATESTFNKPIALTVLPDGTLLEYGGYFPVCRKITALGYTSEDAGNASFTDFKGNGVPYGFLGSGYSDGFGSFVKFNNPMGMASDSNGNAYMADTYNNRIRKRLPSGEWITLAGSGLAGNLDGTALSAQFNKPQGVYVANDGTVYIADSGNKRIRKITSSGVTTVSSTITGFKCPNSLSVDANDNLYICDIGNFNIKKVTPSGTVTIIASGITPNGIIKDLSGNFLFTDASANNIKKISNDSVSIWIDNALVKDGTVRRNRFEQPYGITIDSNGNVYVANNGNNWITKITPN